jgi:hypothetical protein
MWRSTPHFPRLRLHTRSFRSWYHPDKHETDKDAWTAQFQILGAIKRTLSNKEERQKYDRQSRQANLNVERERGHAAEPLPSGERGHAREREAAPPPPARARMSRRASNAANQANADPPPPYRASGHPTTKAVMQRHTETITRLKTEGKALQEDVDNLLTLFDVYDTLPPRPNGIQEGENWDALDQMKPLGQTVGKRFVGAD